MMLVTIREGVAFMAPAALSWLRMEHQEGREIGTNRTTVDFYEQLQLFEDWKAGKHPEIPVVLDPRWSIHVYRDWDANSARAVDTNDNARWEENGWYIVNDDELWHREYQWWNDLHINDTINNDTVRKLMQTLEVWTCAGWEAASQRIVTNGNAILPVAAGHAQALVNAGAAYTNFSRPDQNGNATNPDGNNDFTFAVGCVWQLNGLSEAETQKKLDELIKNTGVKL